MERQTETKLIPWETSLRYDAVVIGWIILMLTAGWGLKAWTEGRATVFTDLDAGLSLRYPGSWSPQTAKGTLLTIRNLQSRGTFKVSFSAEARELDPAAIKPLQELVETYTEERGQELTSYRVLEISDDEVDGQEAAMISYAYVDEPITSPFQTSMPVVVEGVDVLVVHGSHLYVFAFAAPATAFAQQVETLDAILGSVDFTPER